MSPFPTCPGRTLQVRNYLVSGRPLDATSAALKSFPAVLQALTARPLGLPALPESFVADLADSVTAVAAARGPAEEDLMDFKVSGLAGSG